MSSLDEYLKNLANPAERSELERRQRLLPEKLISQIVLLRKNEILQKRQK